MLKALGIAALPLLTLGICQGAFATNLTVTSIVDGQSGPWNYGGSLITGLEISWVQQ
jgi:hypothetical protein